MAIQTVTIEAPEATIKRVVKALCEDAGVEESGPNAKAALVRILTQIVINQERKNASIAVIEGLK